MDEEIIAHLREENQKSEELEERLKIIEEQISEMENFSESLEALEKNHDGEMLASLGKGVFIKSQIREKDLFVDVGSGIIVKKNPEETKKIIEQQTKRLKEMKMQISAEQEVIADNLRGLLEKINKN